MLVAEAYNGSMSGLYLFFLLSEIWSTCNIDFFEVETVIPT